VLKYLNTIGDEGQYPSSKCRIGGIDNQIFMYRHSASSAVELRNPANKSACARTAVDGVCLTRLLSNLSATRYQEKKEEAKWEEALTPFVKS
jgi:hypothetical protein